MQLPEFWPGQSLSAEDSLCEEDQEERRKKLQLSTQQLLKEVREKHRGWESHPGPEHVELAFKKVKLSRTPRCVSFQLSLVQAGLVLFDHRGAVLSDCV